MSDQANVQQTKKQEPYRYPPSCQAIDGVIQASNLTPELLNEITDLPVVEGDVFVNSYPKSGTTWVSEIVWQIFMDGVVDMTPIHERVPYLQWEKSYHANQNKEVNLTEFYLNKPFPRFFKAHLPFHLVPMGDGVTTPKHIYVARNPKDTAVSFYWQHKGFTFYGFDRSWDEFFDMFIEGNIVYGSWFDHVLGWWAHRDDPNVLFLKYEDMKKNLPGAVQQIAKFLGKDLSPEMIERIAKQTTFTAMSDGKGRFVDGEEMPMKDRERNPGIKFLRKGEVGDWQNYFNEEKNKRLDALYDSKVTGGGLEQDFY